MRVIGFDPGLQVTGWGVVTCRSGRLSHVAHGTCRSGNGTLAERLARLFGQVQTVLTEWQPDCAAVEHTFVNKDAAGTLKLGQARAVSLLVPALHGLPVAEYAPNAVKKAVVGVGHADKAQVQHMIGVLLPGVKVASPDAADALALAICHGWAAESAGRRAAALDISGPAR